MTSVRFLNDPGDLNINSSELKIETTTRKGQFSLPNMPANVRAMVRCTGQKGERESMLIDTGGGAFNTVELRGGGHARNECAAFTSEGRAQARTMG